MQWDELKRTGEAPKSGKMLIYTRKEVIFESYLSPDEVRARVNGQTLLEVHLFDEEKEYRALSSQSRRFPEHFIENVFEAKEKTEDSVLNQNILLEQGGSILVRNYISYNDTLGTAVIDNYQLVKEAE
jgi:hypothetical protein